MRTKLTDSTTTAKIVSMPPLLQRLACDAAIEPLKTQEEREEEAIHKLFTDMCKRLDRSQLKVACVNYNIWRAKTIQLLLNDKQTA